MAEMLGYSPQEMTGRSAYDFMDEEGKALAKKRLESRLQGIRGVTNAIHPQGWNAHLDSRQCHASNRRRGQVRRLYQHAYRHHRAQAGRGTLRFEREQLLSLFDSMDTLIYVTDPSTNEILYMNKTMENLFGRQAVAASATENSRAWRHPARSAQTNHPQAEPGPHYWEYYNPKIGRHYSIIDRIIKCPTAAM